ncbi:hypothetical protein FB451DRAFT_1558700 [Mycena latifolia]|nr:hypothetical protein FB451DRAFT_1558700 [Mycena latifolia]
MPSLPAQRKTIAAISNPRTRQPPKQPRAPLTAEQKKQNRDDSEKELGEMDDEIQAWTKYTEETAQRLAERFDKTPRYFLDIFYQGGARMVNSHTKVNAYNAFKSEKAAECRENGEAKRVPQLHVDYHEEYAQLTGEEKAELVERFTETRAEHKIRRATPRARVQDVANTAHNIEMLLSSLSRRVGIEGFFVIVKSTTDFNMEPHWYFTSLELERYMPIAVRKRWNSSEVGGKLEAFAVAGCDPINLLRTAPQKAAFAKGEIRDWISRLLVTITQNSDAVMQYVNYEEDIVHRYGIELVGWTPDKWCNPSDLTSSLTVLRELLDALKSGDCKFVKLSVEELKERITDYKEALAAGEIVGKHRNTRSDMGKKRKRAGSDEDDGGDAHVPAEPNTSMEPSPATTAYSVQEPDDATPRSKRRKTTFGKPRPALPRTAATTIKCFPNPATGNLRKSKAAKAKNAEKENQRDDDTTRAAVERLKKGRAPGSAGGRAFKSRAIITDEDDDEQGTASTSCTDGETHSVSVEPIPAEAAVATLLATVSA